MAGINWKGEISEQKYYVKFRKYNKSFSCDPGPFPNLEMGVYSSSDYAEDSFVGTVDWVEGIGNVSGLLNQCYCIDGGDEVTLKRVYTSCSGVIYEANQAAIEDVEASDDVEIVAIYNVNGQQLQELQPGLNIMKYSDGTVRKVLK